MKRVLIVEDEVRLTELLKAIYGQKFETHIAVTVGEAIACLEQQSFDLVSLDLMIPGECGSAVAEHIHEKKLDCKVVIISGIADGMKSQGQDAEALKQALHAHAYITKPFNLQTVLDVVGELFPDL